jgi:2-keto-4-pentenoate hydratase/2-oxohepta-3-ene-1,7-dioic acid hydratase in catechol pathway
MSMSRRRYLQGLCVGAAASALAVPGCAMSAAASPPPDASAKPQRFVRFECQGRRAYGLVDGDTVRELSGAPFESIAETGKTYPLASVKLLVPVEPTKMLAMAGNYKSHLENTPAPKNPELFIKAPSALLEPEGTIVIPPGTNDVHYEGELVIVIGAKTKNVSPTDAAAHIFGYTCGNDVSARDWQENDKQWWRAKASDTFAPLGPWVVRPLDPAALVLETRVNGAVKQKSVTSELIFGPAAIVSFASAHMTLFPGDLIFTGTPGTTSPMKSGDVVEVEIDKIGVLRSRVG